MSNFKRKNLMSNHTPSVTRSLLPATPAEWVRKGGFNRTLNDQVEEIHLSLLEDKDYIALLASVYDEDAVEGSCAADNIMAAHKIRDYALEKNLSCKKVKLATISKALNVVMRRYSVSRKERRNMLGGQIVSETHNGDE
jgi:hypothetical protein